MDAPFRSRRRRRGHFLLRGKNNRVFVFGNNYFLLDERAKNTRQKKYKRQTDARQRISLPSLLPPLLRIMPSVASFCVKKEEVQHAQANDTIKRCVERLVSKGSIILSLFCLIFFWTRTTACVLDTTDVIVVCCLCIRPE